MSHILPDVLSTGLLLVFCGTAASAKSAQTGAYYANPSNRFWRTLYEVGITPRLFAPQEFRALADLGIGLTDVAKEASGNDSDLTAEDFDSQALQGKIEHYQPKIVAFTSKKAYCTFAEIKSTKNVSYCWQTRKVGQTQLFILTSPSGNNRGNWDITYWQALADEYKQLKNNLLS